NPTRTEIVETFDKYVEALGTNDNLIIFYAGHGYWDTNLQKGFWLPSDASQKSRSNWFSNSELCDYIGGIKARHTIVIADACFSGSIFKTRDAFSDAPVSIKELYNLPSRKAMTSGNLTSVPDKSVFMEYLLKRLVANQEKFLSIGKLFYNLREAVTNNSPNSQSPQFGVVQQTGDEGGEFILIRR
ncbi:MAG: caspase family protein, partial [Verrucomicrobia bacterium]|nr:caspase family protein [Cytophagales bacterium]